LVAADQARWLTGSTSSWATCGPRSRSARTRADPEPGLRLAASLREFWLVRGHGAEGADTLRAFLDMPAAQRATLPRAQALAAAANLVEKTDGYAIAEDYC
jgi:hypothetical protein